MEILYLDKFRGFSNTIIDLVNVNFLVGENSTGKTSLLSLINLISSPDFWFTQNFNLPQHEFGGFVDVLSAGCKRNEEFSFGLSKMLKSPGSKNEKESSFLISYKEEDALPSVSTFAQLIGNKFLALRQFEGGEFRYRSKVFPENELPKMRRDIFSFLSSQVASSLNDFRDFPKEIPKHADFMHLINVVMMESDEYRKERRYYFPIPLFAPNIAWLAPIRTRPKRTYDGYGQLFSPEGEHTPYLIRKIFDSGADAESFRNALNSFGAESGLFSEVVVHKLGDDAAAPFELMIKLKDTCSLRINCVGYGISQVLPLVVEILARNKKTCFSIQQPEVHLHPRAQAALGDLIYQLAERDQKVFFIETHSDFTIDRFRMNFRGEPKHKTSAQILFFERDDIGNKIHLIPIQKNGEFSEEQPPGFRQFFLKEQMNLLGL